MKHSNWFWLGSLAVVLGTLLCSTPLFSCGDYVDQGTRSCCGHGSVSISLCYGIGKGCDQLGTPIDCNDNCEVWSANSGCVSGAENHFPKLFEEKLWVATPRLYACNPEATKELNDWLEKKLAKHRG